MKTRQRIYLVFKRLIGLFGSIAGIVFCLVFLWWWVFPINLIVTKGHPLFAHERYGKNKKVFKLLKFRSMKMEANRNLPPSEMTTETQRSMETKFGRFLRKTSIDETPQLFNIFIGQMAFIGPRPLIDVNDEDVLTINKRKENGSIILKPGLSGYAQLHSRAELDPIEKAEYDYQYLKRFSLWFDFKIFILTIPSLFWGKERKDI